jgi:hypothetical protein
MTATASPRSWRASLDHACVSSPQLGRYATDPREGDSLHLLPEVRRERALFSGNAFGILPLLLAREFTTVVAADWSAARLEVARRRQREERLTNVSYVLADAVEAMARRSGRFDLIVLGEESPDEAFAMPPVDARSLARVRTLVADDGLLMYGVRFRLTHWITRGATRWWTAQAPTTYPAHARRLAAAGFQHVRAYWRSPDRRPYQVYVSLDDPRVITYWLGRCGRPPGLRACVTHGLNVVASQTGCVSHLVDNFLVIARGAR